MLIAPALLVLATALFLIPRAPTFPLVLAVTGVVAASAGILFPILTYWISTKAGNAQGTELGKQTSAASLGSAVGAASGGFLFAVPFSGASFMLMPVVVAIGAGISLGLPRRLGLGYGDGEDAAGRSP